MGYCHHYDDSICPNRSYIDTSMLVELYKAAIDAERAVTEEVVRLRKAGASWSAIADTLGGPRQNAQRRFADLDKKSYTARVQRTGFGWIVNVTGVPAAVFHYPNNEPPSDSWIKTELAAVLDRPSDSFEL